MNVEHVPIEANPKGWHYSGENFKQGRNRTKTRRVGINITAAEKK